MIKLIITLAQEHTIIIIHHFTLREGEKLVQVHADAVMDDLNSNPY